MVMEYLDGQPLDAVIKSRGPFSPQQAIAWIDGMLGALGAAHSSGVIHRDLKPSNIFLVTESDGVELVKVLDFGLAKLRNPDGKAPQTMAGFTVGTPEYMSPEQARGRPLDARSDLYAVGPAPLRAARRGDSVPRRPGGGGDQAGHRGAAAALDPPRGDPAGSRRW